MDLASGVFVVDRTSLLEECRRRQAVPNLNWDGAVQLVDLLLGFRPEGRTLHLISARALDLYGDGTLKVVEGELAAFPAVTILTGSWSAQGERVVASQLRLVESRTELAEQAEFRVQDEALVALRADAEGEPWEIRLVRPDPTPNAWVEGEGTPWWAPWS